MLSARRRSRSAGTDIAEAVNVVPSHSEATPPWRSLRAPAGSGVAVVASAAMIAQQVAGKATRDALFLSNFSVNLLPGMMAFSAVVSLLAALWLSRMLLRYTPATVVPVGFGLSAVALVGTWALSFAAPRLAALVLYLDTSLFGAAMISAFWSLINETFDPHTSRRAATAIAGGGTLGGLLGGLFAWRMSAVITVPAMLPLLAGASVVSLWGTARLRRRSNGPAPREKAAGREGAPETRAERALGPLRAVRRAPYLRNLAAIVALGAVTSGLLDYVFSAEATRTFSKGPALLSFFSCFWLVVGILSFVLQVGLGKLALEKLGVAVTVALLPAVVVFGGAAGLAVPGLWSTAILRGGEATQRNSLFRAAYEMLYTPLSEEKRRSTKTIIDVGFDRIGTMVAAGLIAAALAVTGARAETVLLVTAIGLALATIARSRALHNGYVAVLEESLQKEATKADIAAPGSMSVSEEPVAIRDEIVEQLAAECVTASSADAGASQAVEPLDSSLRAIAELQSRDPMRVRRALAAEPRLSGPVVSFGIILLADKEFHLDALRALRKCASTATGQLVDALCDETSALAVRRRIPRVLAHCPRQDAADGLLRAMADERFEVRYECARALLKMTECAPGIVVVFEKVVAMVQREVVLAKDVWESQPAPDLDEEEGEAPALIDRLLRDHIDRSMEHVFTLLALHLDRRSLRLGFKALHQDDERLRGTALEYLETVLPDEVRDAVWPFLGEERPMRPTRSASDILDDLRRSHDALTLARSAASIDPAA
jgi:AAA family ATP:ADP antiporter